MRAPTLPFSVSHLAIALTFVVCVSAKGHIDDECKPVVKNPVPSEFCLNPPTVPVDLSVYSGTWFNTFVSGSAAFFATEPCITANYTANDNGTVSVLNCNAATIGSVPNCVRAIATRRDNVPMSGNLQVYFPGQPQGPFNPGRYSVAAFIGNATSGYEAVAVYQCSVTPDNVTAPGFYILSRGYPYNAQPWQTLKQLKEKLRCYGYTTLYDWLNIKHKNACKYFFGPDGYTVQELSFTPSPWMTWPPYYYFFLTHYCLSRLIDTCTVLYTLL